MCVCVGACVRACVRAFVSVWTWIIQGQMEDSERNGNQQEHEKSRSSGNGQLSHHFINFLSTITTHPDVNSFRASASFSHTWQFKHMVTYYSDVISRRTDH